MRLGWAMMVASAFGGACRTSSGDAADEPRTPAAVRAPDEDEIARARAHSPIKSDEEVLLFPTVAHLDEDAWQVPLHGWIFEPELDSWRRAAFVETLAAAIGPEATTSPVFASRVQPFVYDDERGKSVAVTIGDRVVELPPSAASGHFEGSTTLAATIPAGPRPAMALTRPGDAREFATVLFLVAPQGLTVISDIDDTVKVSHVTDTETLLRKTFLEPFEVVDGMAQRYRQWLEAAPDSHLHFVSASPWQLLPPLQTMLDEAGFPAASFDLQTLRIKDADALDFLSGTQDKKVDAIAAHVARFPGRRFALIGDSGEHDPEVYGEIARRYPEQVVYIAIRDVTSQAAGAPRYAAAFDGVTARWEVFTDPSTLGGPPPA